MLEWLVLIAGFALVLWLLDDRVFVEQQFGPELRIVEAEEFVHFVPDAAVEGDIHVPAEDRHQSCFPLSPCANDPARDIRFYKWQSSDDELFRSYGEAAERSGWASVPSTEGRQWCHGGVRVEVTRWTLGQPFEFKRDAHGSPLPCSAAVPLKPSDLIIAAVTTLPFIGYLVLAMITSVIGRTRRGLPVAAPGGPTQVATALAWVPYVVIAIRPGLELAMTDTQRWLGLALAFGGICFSIWALLTLGRHFDLEIEVHRDHEIVRRGPYRFVRHPAYTGLGLHLIGACIATGNLLLIAGTIFVALPVLYARARVEEWLLRRHLGQDYDRYAREVPMLVPGLRR